MKETAIDWLRQLMSVTVICAAISGVATGPATASTAQLVELSVYARCDITPRLCDPPPPLETALVFLGGGEANRVSLTPGAQRVRISDPSSRIAPGPGCARVDDHSVSCSVPRVLTYVATGAGSDRVVSQLGSASTLTVDGAAGDDLLTGGLGPDALLGGRGRDRLRGRGGNDRLFDSSSPQPVRGGTQSPTSGGSDVFFGGILASGRGGDSFDGGSGNDTISYEGRRARLRIDLATGAPVAGARGERDSVRRVENATGGAGADRIAGNRRRNRLLGEAPPPVGGPGGGGDRIAGRRGADSLAGGAGRNVLSGGSGDDAIALGVSGRERVFCGAGRDSVTSPQAGDFLQADCEEPVLTGLIDGVLSPPLLRSRLPLREGRPPNVLSGRASCFLDNACQAILELRVQGAGTRRGTAPPRGTLLGSRSVPIGVGETKSFDLRLSPAGLGLLRRHRALRVRLIVATPRSSSRPPGYTTLLRAP